MTCVDGMCGAVPYSTGTDVECHPVQYAAKRCGRAADAVLMADRLDVTMELRVTDKCLNSRAEMRSCEET